jgi:hypothetical protein
MAGKCALFFFNLGENMAEKIVLFLNLGEKNVLFLNLGEKNGGKNVLFLNLGEKMGKSVLYLNLDENGGKMMFTYLLSGFRISAGRKYVRWENILIINMYI